MRRAIFTLSATAATLGGFVLFGALASAIGTGTSGHPPDYADAWRMFWTAAGILSIALAGVMGSIR